MMLSVALHGSGVRGDPYTVDVPTCSLVALDTTAMTALVEIPDGLTPRQNASVSQLRLYWRTLYGVSYDPATPRGPNPQASKPPGIVIRRRQAP